MNLAIRSLVVAAGFGLLALPVAASTIVSATVIGNSLGQFASLYPPSNLVDQSGLSVPYVSGVTDFDSFAATHGTGPTFDFVAENPTILPGTLDFDLGAVYSVAGLGLWNDSQLSGTATRGLNAFSVVVASLSDFSDGVGVGSFNASEVTTLTSNIERFDLTGATGRYVRITAESTHGSPLLQMGEVAFGVDPVAPVPVPVPAALPLLGAGLAALSLVRRRRRG